jgi:hypothetical protein
MFWDLLDASKVYTLMHFDIIALAAGRVSRTAPPIRHMTGLSSMLMNI